MSTSVQRVQGLAVLSQASASSPDRALFDPHAVRTIRYADEASWTVGTALARAMAPLRETRPGLLERMGLIVTSAEGPAATILAVAADGRAGRPSPLRFPAANPGALAGVACILFGLRGPVANLLLPPERGLPVAWVLASSSLAQGAVTCIAVVSVVRPGVCSTVARALLLGRGEGSQEQDREFPDTKAWLTEPDAGDEWWNICR